MNHKRKDCKIRTIWHKSGEKTTHETSWYLEHKLAVKMNYSKALKNTRKLLYPQTRCRMAAAACFELLSILRLVPFKKWSYIHVCACWLALQSLARSARTLSSVTGAGKAVEPCFRRHLRKKLPTR